nr:hypothetical protein [Oryza sativa Japonica Group]
MEDADAPRQLLSDADLDLVSDRERQAYYMLSDREYAHTREYSPELLKKIGMDVEFCSIWKAVGWQRFAVVDEPGSRLLTLQFLCTLKEIEDGISFRFFRKKFTLTWKGLSTLLGFHDSCKIDTQKGISGFEKNRFWEDISGAPICKKPRTNNIHNPTLRLMHKWIAMILFPRSDLRPIMGDELIIMFAMVWHQLRMHPDGPKLHAIASESQPGQALVRTGGMCLMTFTRGTTNPPGQVDLGEITRRMDTLDVQTVEIQYDLMEHIAQTQEWQESADAQFANINNMMQQQHDDLQAYFRFQGFNPYQGP